MEALHTHFKKMTAEFDIFFPQLEKAAKESIGHETKGP
jgi:hypothetical protein